MKRKSRIKYVPIAYSYDQETVENDMEPSCFVYETGTFDKYGLHYIDHSSEEPKFVRLKGKKYGKAPYSYNSYEEMMDGCRKIWNAEHTAEIAARTRKTALFLVVADENETWFDPHHLEGFVTNHGTMFRITSSGTHNGEKWIRITDENRHLIFSDMVKAADYVYENYGLFAMNHYLKNIPGVF